MRAIRLRGLIVLGLAGSFLAPAGARAGMLTRKIVADGGASVVIRARDFTPGDIMLLTVENAAALREADVKWRGREYRLETARRGGNPLAFAGIDFELKAGAYPLEVTFVDDSGRKRTVSDSVEVKPRQFRVRRLVLDEKFVVAPPEQLERIRRDREMVLAAYGKPIPEWLGDGSFDLPHQGLMFFNFGDRRVYNGRPGSAHAGVDISANKGDPILASNAGRVVLAADLYFSGNTVIIDHGLGVFTSYFHMSRLLVRTGEVVPKGHVLGEAGSTGRSTGPHLHWGVTIFGSRVDPRALLRLPLLDWPKPDRAAPPSGTRVARPDRANDAPGAVMPAATVRPASPGAPVQPEATPAGTAGGKTPGRAKGAYFIQLAALAEKAAAEGLASRIRAAGYPTVVLDPRPGDKRPWYRVRVGGYATRDEAQTVVRQLRRVVTGRPFECWITRD
jgi:murein DD-endopeptidase MepM/ murein hydrolase activator NlpD